MKSNKVREDTHLVFLSLYFKTEINRWKITSLETFEHVEFLAKPVENCFSIRLQYSKTPENTNYFDSSDVNFKKT